MENALLIGLSRQMILHRELDVVSNNIANLNTTGFKGDGAVFEEFLMPGAREGQFAGRDSRVSFVQDRSTWHDMSQGPLQQTGSPLDVAVDGAAFLVVETPRGELGTWVISDGTANPYRLKIRPPSLHHLSALPYILPGLTVSDAVATLGSLDPIMGEVDR